MFIERVIWRYKQGNVEQKTVGIAEEYPMTIYFNQQEIITLLCTPQHYDELAIGFLLSEGLLTEVSELQNITIDQESGQAWIESSTTDKLNISPKRFIGSGCLQTRAFYRVDDLDYSYPPVDFTINSTRIPELVRQLSEQSQLYRTAGGVHGAALAGDDGSLLVREDIGRHNAVDKLLGKAWLTNWDLNKSILITTGRVASDLVTKISKRGLPVIISRSAPTSLARELAERTGITLVGYARGESFNVYTHAFRIK